METISITRIINGNADEKVCIHIKDGNRKIFKGYMTLDNYARAATGRSEVEFEPKP